MNNRLFISIMTIFVAAILAVIIIPSASGFGFAPHGPSPAVNARKSSRHLLQYRRTMDDDIDLPILTQLANGNVAAADGIIVSSSPATFLQMMRPRGNEKSAMDDYLEYIDKRYCHLPSSSTTGCEFVPASPTHHHRYLSFATLGLSRLSPAPFRIMTTMTKYVSRFLKLSFLCGATLFHLVRSNRYYI